MILTRDGSLFKGEIIVPSIWIDSWFDCGDTVDLRFGNDLDDAYKCRFDGLKFVMDGKIVVPPMSLRKYMWDRFRTLPFEMELVCI